MGTALSLILLFCVTQLSAAPFLPVRRDRLLLYTPMLEGSGTQIIDQSSYRSTMTLVGNVAWVKDPGGFAIDKGTKTYAPTIDGAVYLPELLGARLEVGGNTSRFNFISGIEFSIAWVMSLEKNQHNCAIMGAVGSGGCAGCGGRCGWYLWHRTDAPGARVQIGNCAAANNYGNLTFTPDNRMAHFWAMTKNDVTVKFYIDGKLVDTVSMPTSGFGSNGNTAVIIGDPVPGAGTPNEFIGKFGTIALWNTTLSDAEIYNMYQSQFRRVE